jgi:hypothetical protein
MATILLLIWAWVATVSAIIISLRVLHLLAIQRRLEWLLMNQGKALDRAVTDKNEMLDIIADLRAEIAKLEKLAKSEGWELGFSTHSE